MRLSPATVGALPSAVSRPTYNREDQKCGIVHLGIGAFHRAHQAVYTDEAMSAGDKDWGIVGVSLRSPTVRDQLNPQGGLFTVCECSESAINMKLIGSVQTVLVASETPDLVIGALASPHTSIVTLTVTEKGYFLTPSGVLDVDAEDIKNDLAGIAAPRTIYGFLARALALRYQSSCKGLTIISCDNLSNNGFKLFALLSEFLGLINKSLQAWFIDCCACPSTMVDRIVPATTDEDRERISAKIGLQDRALVLTEPFRQWVIENRFAGARPTWEVGGAQIVRDVLPYETAKLRMLNGAHSAIAYLGLQRGYEFVHEAIANREIRQIVEKIMRDEASASLGHTEVDVSAYADALLTRFTNSALAHRLAQIAMDGSQKIPQRWLEPLAINSAVGKECPATLSALAAWILHIRGDLHNVNDPIAILLANLWHNVGQTGIVAALFGENGIFRSHWIASATQQQTLNRFLATPV